MKTLYYTVEKELQYVGDVEETTGYKNIIIYDIVDNKPKIVIEMYTDNENSTENELDYFVGDALMDEDFETHLDKEETYIFEIL